MLPKPRAGSRIHSASSEMRSWVHIAGSQRASPGKPAAYRLGSTKVSCSRSRGAEPRERAHAASTEPCDARALIRVERRERRRRAMPPFLPIAHGSRLCLTAQTLLRHWLAAGAQRRSNSAQKLCVPPRSVDLTRLLCFTSCACRDVPRPAACAWPALLLKGHGKGQSCTRITILFSDATHQVILLLPVSEKICKTTCFQMQIVVKPR